MITGKDLEDMGYFDQFDLNKPEDSTVLADYTDWVEKKIVTTGDDRLIENTLGLVGEAGEVAEKIKKKIRDRNKVSSEEIVKELGDVLFYVTALANHFGENLAIVMEKNVAKLDDREKKRNTTRIGRQQMNNYLPTDYQAFIHTSRYAKYFDGKGREAWPETVDRYIENVIGDKVDSDTKDEIMFAILNLEIMPSMRAMMTAGIALDRDNTAGYNCSYLPVDDPKSFDEAMFILLCGTGVGFSVERQFISKLPEIPKLFDSDTTIVVKDSKEGMG